MYSWSFSKSIHDFFEAVCTGSKLTWCMYTVKPGPAGIDVGSTGTERICAQHTAILASCVIHAIVSSLHIAAHTDRQRRLLSLLLTRSRAAASLFKHAPAPATLRTSRGPKLRLQSAPKPCVCYFTNPRLHAAHFLFAGPWWGHLFVESYYCIAFSSMRHVGNAHVHSRVSTICKLSKLLWFFLKKTPYNLALDLWPKRPST